MRIQIVQVVAERTLQATVDWIETITTSGMIQKIRRLPRRHGVISSAQRRVFSDSDQPGMGKRDDELRLTACARGKCGDKSRLTLSSIEQLVLIFDSSTT